MTDQEDREFMAAIEADAIRRLPAAMEDLIPGLSAAQAPLPDVTDWVERGSSTDPPAVDPMDVTWPDGTFKVFPDHAEFTVNVDMVAPEARSIWSTIMAEVRHRRLEETILGELAAIITERGKDAPGILIIKTPDGQWAIKESEWLAPGSAVLSTMDQPDLMAVAQEGDGWLYYRQGPSWGEQAGVPDTATMDIVPTLPDSWGPEPWARMAWEADLP